MGATVEVKYFNSFVLKKSIGITPDDNPRWYGSWGIPASVAGGFDPALPPAKPNNWAIEESRIRGGFNNTSVDFGAKAYLVEEEPAGYVRFNALIYSGIFNSRTGINNTNVFSTADDITKATDPANGSIQKLYAEDTNLNIFQEFKVSRALIDKDAIFTAEGNPAVTSSNLVIGVIQPLAGKYGISQNPESFAVYGTNKYFTDKFNNVVMSLRGGSLVEISQLGMRDFFRDQLNDLDTGNILGQCIGGWDIYNQQYVLSLQPSSAAKSSNKTFSTVTYDEGVQGWTSLFDYEPSQIISIRNKMYTTGIKTQGFGNVQGLFEHYSLNVPRGQFYGEDYNSTVTVIFNPEPTRSKTFSTINYEGANGWFVQSAISDQTGLNQNPVSGLYSNSVDTTNSILSYYEGEYVINPATNLPVVRADYNLVFGTDDPPLSRNYAGFNRKENSYVANVINTTPATAGEIVFGNEISGIKGYFIETTFSTDTTTDPGGTKILFSVGAKFDSNNGY
tara:strand:+ start:3542 stop:5056 length:1515 start_codon:yes stop_codon:yes gene_type:complete